MEKDVSKYKQLEKELSIYKPMMQEAADTIINENVSLYPIFVVHQHQMEIGIPILDHTKQNGKWSIHASSMEEFVSKNIIQEIKIDSFRTIYKDSKNHLCLFVLSELGAEFVFLKRDDRTAK